MSLAFRLIFKTFIIYCVVYTVSDCYKKRRRFLWVLHIVRNNIQIVTYALLGEELYSTLAQYTNTMSGRKKLKKKI